jgi:D-arabinose 1-dehydrogenase-like Zn-dependent alcohol dehydrogenase
VQLLSDGYIKSEVKLRDFSEVNDILDEIEAGQVIGRNVVKIPGGEAEE